MVPVSLHEAVLSVRSRPVRFPARLGGADRERLDEIHLTLELSTADGRRARGVAADVLAPAWFDPLLPTGARALAAGARTAVDVAVASARVPRPVYRIWRDAYEAAVALGGDRGMSPLAAGHGAALLERALFDGLGRALDLPYHEVLRRNLGGIDLGDVHPELAGAAPADVLPPRPARPPPGTPHRRPRRSSCGRRTCPKGPVPAATRRSRWRPASAGRGCGTSASSWRAAPNPTGTASSGSPRISPTWSGLSVVLDGGEAFDDPAHLHGLLDRLESGPEAGRRLYSAIAWVEQPFPRAEALDPALLPGGGGAGRAQAGLHRRVRRDPRRLQARRRPGIRGHLGPHRQRPDEGAGQSGPLPALERRPAVSGRPFRLAGAELLSLPVAGLHQHLAQMAALGVDPVECRGAWHEPGLGHLSPAERGACRQIHGGLYEELAEDRASPAESGARKRSRVGLYEELAEDRASPAERGACAPRHGGLYEEPARRREGPASGAASGSTRSWRRTVRPWRCAAGVWTRPA